MLTQLMTVAASYIHSIIKRWYIIANFAMYVAI